MTDNMMLITLFDTLYPCWTEDMLAREGVDMGALEKLVEEGLVLGGDGVFSLTDEGRAEFARIAAENFIEEKPGFPPSDRIRSARAGRFLKMLDAAHLQRWGIKEYYTSPSLPIFPRSDGREVFRTDGEKLSWLYMDWPDERLFEKDFPPASIDGRRDKMAARGARAEAWLEENKGRLGTFVPDVFYVCRYDYIYYEDFKGHPNDPMRLVNADRFAFTFSCGDENEDLHTVGEFRRWLMLCRRALMPGYFDIDTQEQDSLCVLYLVLRTEAEATAQAELLARFGAALTENVEPFEIWTLSEEILASVKEKRELVWELLPEIAHPVRRMEGYGCCRV